MEREKFYPVFFAGVGFASMVVANAFLSRPYYSSIYKHIAVAGAGWFFGHQLHKNYDRRQRQRLLILQDYVDKHPEDFIEPERRKFKDILLPWQPIR